MPKGIKVVWSDDEDQFLRENAGKMSSRRIASALKKTSAQAIETRCSQLGLEWRVGLWKKEWTEEEDQRLRQLAGEISATQIANSFSVSKQQVETRCDYLGVGWRTKRVESTREAALRDGSTTYKSERDCKKHPAPILRRTVNASCILCEKERTKKPNYRAHQQARKKRTEESFAELSPNDKRRVFKIYRESERLTRETGIQHHVDHIIPVKLGGRHIPENLRIITAAENHRKSASLPDDVPKALEEALAKAKSIDCAPSPKYKESAIAREKARMVKTAEKYGIPLEDYERMSQDEKGNSKQWLRSHPGKTYRDFLDRPQGHNRAATSALTRQINNARMLCTHIDEYREIPHKKKCKWLKLARLSIKRGIICKESEQQMQSRDVA